ncbi:MAG: nicotinate phosphoribosyltransferase [Acidithiobacillus sp.]|jgi:nicotinate phosphoribosyltransferase|uniref:nicotinate phosphoribosyltransferase n=1 Tax=Acidithiobacillus sp. TaxID=1872118 RepID=UPI00355EA578
MIITSLLDNDLYKITMMQAVYRKYSSTKVEYEFYCRTENVEFTLDDACEIKNEIENLSKLKFKESELIYLQELRFIFPDFVQFLKLFRLDFKFVHFDYNQDKKMIKINICGPWLHTILYEVPILSIINEIYNKNHRDKALKEIETEGYKRLSNKSLLFDEQWQKHNDFKIADFGTRRRYSRIWHNNVVNLLSSWTNVIVGTSNMKIAKDLNLTPLGTMAHEWFQAHQQLGYQIRLSQRNALQAWADVYRGDLGIALTDTIGIDAFLNDFDLYFAKLFDGVRHDSGSHYEFADKIITHYKKLKIDPKTKTIIFSDGLTQKLAIDIFNKFHDKINVSFGIGTNLTNDCGNKVLQIVIKMIKCNGYPVAKISDNKSKIICYDSQYLSYLKHIFNLE